MVPCRALGRCLTALWSLSSKERARSHSEHLHQPLYVAPLAGFLSENYPVHQAWRSNMTFLLHHRFNSWSSFWFLIRVWLIPEQARESTSTTLSVSTLMYKVADFARREFLSSCGLPEREQCITLPSSKIREYGSTAHCTCSAFSNWLWSFSKQLLHHSH